MVEIVSPIGPARKPGRHGGGETAGVVISERRLGAIVQVAAFAGREAAVLDALNRTASVKLVARPGAGCVNGERNAFNFAPGRWLVADEGVGIAAALAGAVPAKDGAVVSLAHGRTVLRIDGRQADWVLAKLFAIDFSRDAFPVGEAVSTAHHDVFAQVQRVADCAFDLYVFRSFARSFFTALCHAAEETGYEVL